MRTTRQMSVTLPNEMADLVKAKVASGEYASESEVVRDGLRALAAREKAVEAWLRNEVVPAYEEYKANPGSGLSVDQVRAMIAEEYRNAVKRGQ